MKTLIIMSALIGSMAMAEEAGHTGTPATGAPAATHDMKKMTNKEAKAMCKADAKASGKKMSKGEMKDCMKSKKM